MKKKLFSHKSSTTTITVVVFQASPALLHDDNASSPLAAANCGPDRDRRVDICVCNANNL